MTTTEYGERAARRSARRAARGSAAVSTFESSSPSMRPAAARRQDARRDHERAGAGAAAGLVGAGDQLEPGPAQRRLVAAERPVAAHDQPRRPELRAAARAAQVVTDVMTRTRLPRRGRRRAAPPDQEHGTTRGRRDRARQPAHGRRRSKVDGVPSVRQRDGGQAMTNALPMTSSTGTVLVVGSQSGRSACPCRRCRSGTGSRPSRCGGRP